ncbi:MAG: hypothetical protein GY714_23585 [Desulfobacterales bacterium]|nr:hypothetical protein [Desulfobacterales bacterium]
MGIRLEWIYERIESVRWCIGDIGVVSCWCSWMVMQIVMWYTIRWMSKYKYRCWMMGIL